MSDRAVPADKKLVVPEKRPEWHCDTYEDYLALKKIDIIILGVSGTGKTTVAELLEKLGYTVADIAVESKLDAPDAALARLDVSLQGLNIDLLKRLKSEGSFIVGMGCEDIDILLDRRERTLRWTTVSSRFKELSKGPEWHRSRAKKDNGVVKAVFRATKCFVLDVKNLMPEGAANRIVELLAEHRRIYACTSPFKEPSPS